MVHTLHTVHIRTSYHILEGAGSYPEIFYKKKKNHIIGILQIKTIKSLGAPSLEFEKKKYFLPQEIQVKNIGLGTYDAS